MRIISETLKLTRNNPIVSLIEIAEKAGTTTALAKTILGDSVGIEDAKLAFVDSPMRFKLAIDAVRRGALLQVARALTWQEFETFSGECLRTTGFYTRKGVVVKDISRRWQIDVIGKKGPMILAVDCKHWESPGYESKLSKAAEHQTLAVQALIKQMIAGGEVDREGVLALPIILTLFEPRSREIDGAVVVPVEQFADFLEGVSPFSSELPFIHAQSIAKSSIN